MLKNLLLPLLFTNFLFAQESIEIKPMTWEGLLEFQKDSLLPVKALKLSLLCPNSILDLHENYSAYPVSVKRILGSYFIWTEFYDQNYDICVVKHLKTQSLKENPINPNSYMILTPLEAQILLSAAQEFGFKRKNVNTKEFEDELKKIRWQGDHLTTEKLNAYGGESNLYMYMESHKSTKSKTFITRTYIAENVYKSLRDFKEGPVHPISHKEVLLKFFEQYYSEKQRLKLKDSIKNRRYSKSDLILMNNNWSLVSLKDIDSSRKDILENSKYIIKFNKENYQFTGFLGCNNFSGSFRLDKDNLKLNIGSTTLLACSLTPILKKINNSNLLDNEISIQKNNPKEKSLMQQTDLITDIINNVIGYEINDSELILFTQDSRRLFFK